MTATEIKIGMANALSGPTAGLGQGIKAGSEAYFEKVNAGPCGLGRGAATVPRLAGFSAFAPSAKSTSRGHFFAQYANKWRKALAFPKSACQNASTRSVTSSTQIYEQDIK